MTSRIYTGVIILIMATLSLGSAEPPPFSQVPATLIQRRDGIGNVLTKLKAGAEVRIAYFGGSITAAGGWRVKTLQWFQEAYPGARVSEINAAIGGTGSDLGVFRYKQDVLDKQPDLVFVEFAVNDSGAPPQRIWRAMEGIIRQTWKTDPTIDICYVYTFAVGQQTHLDQGKCPPAASADEMLAEYYGIPAINVAMKTAELCRDGKLIYVPTKDAEGKAQPIPEGVMLFSTDGVHPSAPAHGMYTEVIADAVRQMEQPVAMAGPHELKAPYIADNWELARLVPVEPWMLTPGWTKLDPTTGLGKSFHHFMPEMWEATQPGEKIAFRFKGTGVRLYDILGPDGALVVTTLNGKAGHPVPRFDSYCSYHRLATLGIADGLPEGEHTVSVEIQSEQPDRSSVVDREKGKPGFDPKRYDGTGMRVGGIMLLGDIVRP